MASLLEVKKQIGAIRNTRKITKAMQLVATSRMKHLQKRALSVRHFSAELINLWTNKLSSTEASRFQAVRPTGKRVFVLYSSDKGLCGGMNQQLIKALINSTLWKETPETNRIVVTFGRKGTDYLRFRKIPVTKSFINIPDRLDTAEAYGYIDELLKFWDNPEVEAVYMVAPHYKNSFTFYPIIKQFLPITPEALRAHLGPDYVNSEIATATDELIYFEPDKQAISEDLIANLAQSLFLQAFYELKATEYSSRMLAMQNATTSAGKLIDEKTRLLNMIRQQRITQEIAEITGSATVIQ